MRRGLFILCMLASLGAMGEVIWTAHSDASHLADLSLSESHLWAVGRGGVLRIDRVSGEKQLLRTPDGLPGNDIQCVLAVSDEEIWLGTVGLGLLRYRPNEGDPWKRFQRLPQGLAGNDILAMALDSQDRLWYGCAFHEVEGSLPEGGFGLIEGDAPGAIWGEPEGLENLDVRALAFAGDTLFVGTGAGVYVLDPDWQLSLDTEAPGEEIDDLVVAEDRVWALTEGQLRTRGLDGSEWSFVAMPPGAGSPTAIAVAEEHIYAAVRNSISGTGVYRYEFSTGEWEDLSLGLPEPSWAYDYFTEPVMGTLLAAPGGDVWMGGEVTSGLGPGLFTRSAGIWSVDPLDQGPMGPAIKALDFGPSGRLWTASNVGASTEDDGNWFRFRQLKDYNYWPAWSLALMEDSQDWVWFCRFNSGSSDPFPFARMHAETLEIESLPIGPAGAPSSRIVAMGEDASGNRWFATDDAGIAVCDRFDNWTRYSSDPEQGGLPSSFVNDLAFLPGARVAMLCSGVGLCVWEPATGTFWTPSSSSSSGTVYDPSGYLADDTTGGSLAATQSGEIWVGQQDGLIQVVASGNSYFVLGKLGKSNGDSPGLLNSQVNDLAAAHDGSVWVATVSGLSHVDLDRDLSLWSVDNYTNAAGLAEVDPDGFIFGPEVLAPLPEAYIYRVAVSPDGGRIVAGTRENGLIELELLADPPQSPDAISRIRLYPNPIRLSLGHRQVQFTGVDFPVDVRIYNLEGQMVRELLEVQPGEPIWPDLTTRFGNRATSGIYLVHLTYEGRTELRSLALVR